MFIFRTYQKNEESILISNDWDRKSKIMVPFIISSCKLIEYIHNSSQLLLKSSNTVMSIHVNVLADRVDSILYHY